MYVASCSFGKDSLAMVLNLIERNYPLDEVAFFDTGMEFQAIYNLRDRMVPLIESHGVRFREFKIAEPFEYMMLDKPITRRDGTVHYGHGWCGGTNRWGTAQKVRTMNKYFKDKTQYIGIAYDETERIKKHENEPNILMPLVDWKMTEKDCLEYCYSKGYDWNENGVELYDILDRVSCWCCANKNRKELKNIYFYLPEYWERLKDLQSKIDIPMKHYCNKQYGEYGNVFALEKVFKLETDTSD